MTDWLPAKAPLHGVMQYFRSHREKRWVVTTTVIQSSLPHDPPILSVCLASKRARATSSEGDVGSQTACRDLFRADIIFIDHRPEEDGRTHALSALDLWYDTYHRPGLELCMSLTYLPGT